MPLSFIFAPKVEKGSVCVGAIAKPPRYVVEHSPSDSQMFRLNQLLPVVLSLRGRSLESKREELSKYGVELVEKRVPCLCEVGSYWWYPRFRCFRLVVSSPRIDSRKVSYPYAWVVEVPRTPY